MFNILAPTNWICLVTNTDDPEVRVKVRNIWWQLFTTSNN